MSYIAKLKQLDLEKITNAGLKSVIQKNIEQFDESKATDKGKEQIKLMYELVEKKFPDAIKKEVEPKKEETKKEEKTEPKDGKKIYLSKVFIHWTEGSSQKPQGYKDLEVKSMDELQEILSTLYDDKEGYSKVKIEFTWTDGKTILDRADVGSSKGDFNPSKENIKDYLKKSISDGGVMYKTTVPKGGITKGEYVFDFDSKKKAAVKKEAPKPKAKPEAKKSEPKKEDDKTVKISSINPKDKADDVKDILEKEHYKVIVRKVGTKTTKVKVKRTDSQVAKEKIKSAFATITKTANSAAEKKELKSELQKVAEIRRQVITIIGNTYSAFKHGDLKQLDSILGKVKKFEDGGVIDEASKSFTVNHFNKGDEVYLVGGDGEPFGMVTGVGSKTVKVKKHSNNSEVYKAPTELYLGKEWHNFNKGKEQFGEGGGVGSKAIKSTVYEIKSKGKWSKVRATSMKALSDWAKENNVSDWRMVGMMSRAELQESQNLEVVV